MQTPRDFHGKRRAASGSQGLFVSDDACITHIKNMQIMSHFVAYGDVPLSCDVVHGRATPRQLKTSLFLHLLRDEGKRKTAIYKPRCFAAELNYAVVSLLGDAWLIANINVSMSCATKRSARWFYTHFSLSRALTGSPIWQYTHFDLSNIAELWDIVIAG